MHISSRTRLLARSAAAAAALLTLAACSSPAEPAARTTAATSTSFSISGQVAVQAKDYSGPEGCSTNAGYADVAPGAQVVVTDQGGATVALGQLGSVTADHVHADCVYSISVDGVPTGKDFYGVQVTHRGAVQFTEDQVRSPISLTIGANAG